MHVFDLAAQLYHRSQHPTRDDAESRGNFDASERNSEGTSADEFDASKRFAQSASVLLSNGTSDRSSNQDSR
jgi:hypothetical protein